MAEDVSSENTCKLVAEDPLNRADYYARHRRAAIILSFPRRSYTRRDVYSSSFKCRQMQIGLNVVSVSVLRRANILIPEEK